MKAKENIPIGLMVTYDENFNLHALKNKLETPIGISGRDIKKGETVEYNSRKNTKDIIVKTNPGGWCINGTLSRM